MREGELEGRGAGREDKWRRIAGKEQEGRRAGWKAKGEGSWKGGQLVPDGMLVRRGPEGS